MYFVPPDIFQNINMAKALGQPFGSMVLGASYGSNTPASAWAPGASQNRPDPFAAAAGPPDRLAQTPGYSLPPFIPGTNMFATPGETESLKRAADDFAAGKMDWAGPLAKPPGYDDQMARYRRLAEWAKTGQVPAGGLASPWNVPQGGNWDDNRGAAWGPATSPTGPAGGGSMARPTNPPATGGGAVGTMAGPGRAGPDIAGPGPASMAVNAGGRSPFNYTPGPPSARNEAGVNYSSGYSGSYPGGSPSSFAAPGVASRGGWPARPGAPSSPSGRTTFLNAPGRYSRFGGRGRRFF